jgi:hypothetical protein
MIPVETTPEVGKGWGKGNDVRTFVRTFVNITMFP